MLAVVLVLVCVPGQVYPNTLHGHFAILQEFARQEVEFSLPYPSTIGLRIMADRFPDVAAFLHDELPANIG
jgi:hypothetical protein